MPMYKEASELREILNRLLGREVKVTPGRSFMPGPSKPTVTTTYLADDGSLSAMIGADLQLAAAMGTALAMMFPKDVKDAVKQGAMPEMLEENYFEVGNILSRLFNEGSRHVTIERVLQHRVVPPELKAEWKTLRRQGTHFNVDVTGYGKGVFSLHAM